MGRTESIYRCDPRSGAPARGIFEASCFTSAESLGRNTCVESTGDAAKRVADVYELRVVLLGSGGYRDDPGHALRGACDRSDDAVRFGTATQRFSRNHV